MRNTNRRVVRYFRDVNGTEHVCGADSGHGVPDELIGQLFQPFITTKAQGMGLGLSICRTIIEAHGGHISVESEGGVGTIFTFTLPRAPKEDQDAS